MNCRYRRRYRLLGRWNGRYWWQSVLPVDSRYEQISCDVSWFWSGSSVS